MREFPEFNDTYRFRTKIQVRFNDVDRIGHINNIVWQEYFDVARIQYFHEVLKISRFTDNVSFVIVNINSDYITSLYADDEIWVETKVSHIGNRSIKMCQKIYAIRQGQIVNAGIGRSVMSCVDISKSQSLLVPDDVATRIRAYEIDVD